MTTWQFLHESAPGVYHLDHRLTPEVRAMFAAMSSRLPAGGISGRYKQIVDAIAEAMFDPQLLADADEQKTAWAIGEAENKLTTYPLHPRVQEFFDKFVLRYGHSSIMELTGSPPVYSEGISWYDAYLLFDSPLCSGQEFSTRAVKHKNWPMARSAMPNPTEQFRMSTDPEAQTWILEELHAEWFEVFNAEVAWWKVLFSLESNRKAFGLKDKEPFRPALDRARWALPGTIATGCCHTGHLRERSRILRDGLLLAQRSGAEMAVEVWENIRKGYADALPGLSGMGLREAVYSSDAAIPAHLLVFDVEPGDEVEVRLMPTREYIYVGTKSRLPGVRSYLDPSFNQIARVDISFRCSLAVARDWHRHRTMYPWALNIVRRFGEVGEDTPLRIHSGYEPKSAFGKRHLGALLQKSSKAYNDFMQAGNQMQAMLCLPLGTEVQLKGQGGLRDVIYMLELRANAHGANFEYEAQAKEALLQLKSQLSAATYRAGSPIPIDILRVMGLQE